MWLKPLLVAKGINGMAIFFEGVFIHLGDSPLLQAFADGQDGFYHASLYPIIKDWSQF